MHEKVMYMICNIQFTWDPDACVWIATSDDVPGLVLESESYDVLVERTRTAVPELLELNGALVKPLTLSFQSDRQERIAL